MREPFYRHVLDETCRLRGVTGAAYTSFLPIVMGGGIWPVQIQGHPEDLASRRTVSLRFVTPGFSFTMASHSWLAAMCAAVTLAPRPL